MTRPPEIAPGISFGTARDKALDKVSPAPLIVAFATFAVLSCSSGRERPGGPTHTVTTEPMAAIGQPVSDDTSPLATDDATPISEAVARALLSERFRAAGFRIVHDVRITSPERQKER